MTKENTPTDETKIALIGNDVSHIMKDLGEIKQSLKELSGVYATQVAVSESQKDTDVRIKKLEDSSNLWKWLSPSLSAVLGSLFTFLIIQYLTNQVH